MMQCMMGWESCNRNRLLLATAVFPPPTLMSLTAMTAFCVTRAPTMLMVVAVPVNMTGCTVDPRANGLYAPTFNLYKDTTVDYYTLGT